MQRFGTGRYKAEALRQNALHATQRIHVALRLKQFKILQQNFILKINKKLNPKFLYWRK